MEGAIAESAAAPATRAAESNAAYRARYRAEQVPAWYRGELHVASTLAWVLAPAAYCMTRLHDVQPMEWLTVPAMLVFGSLFVWALHRYVLHRPVPGLRFAYVIHTLHHHRFYTREHAEPESRRDFHITLFPMRFAPTLALSSLLLGGYVVSGLGDNVGWLFAAMSVLYFGLYELVHFASHLPATSPVTRLPLIAPLRRHHRLHHDPRLMKRHNFNVVLPLFDVLLGTSITEAEAPAPRGG